MADCIIKYKDKIISNEYGIIRGSVITYIELINDN